MLDHRALIQPPLLFSEIENGVLHMGLNIEICADSLHIESENIILAKSEHGNRESAAPG
jgi:hypothetical protein